MPILCDKLETCTMATNLQQAVSKSHDADGAVVLLCFESKVTSLCGACFHKDSLNSALERE